MAWSAVAWATQDELTSDKLTKMVENLKAHDHRHDGSQGAPVVRVAHGTEQIATVGGTSVYVTVNYPANRFDPAGPVPIIVVGVEAASIGAAGVVRSWGCRNMTHTSADIFVHRTGTTVMPVTWTAVQAPA